MILSSTSPYSLLKEFSIACGFKYDAVFSRFSQYFLTSIVDDTFPISQFIIQGFSKPYRLDRNRRGGGLLIYVREDIPSKKLIKHTFPHDIEGLCIEINLRKCKWFLCGTYQ